MKMLNGYILIRVDEENNLSKGGIALQTGAVKLPSRGTVEAVPADETDIKVGDRVEFLRYASLDGTNENTRICSKDMLIGVLDGKD